MTKQPLSLDRLAGADIGPEVCLVFPSRISYGITPNRNERNDSEAWMRVIKEERSVAQAGAVGFHARRDPGFTVRLSSRPLMRSA